ncbi:uncharacterized protein G2W53_021520 [Senna tora]|uniref:Uncharacterized protein n=1 Tax=Senna tora TaxID=362788 RepID=A0A834TM49_9FABA|nr:uncharacterized protein G2W53_021520 [Senna tora]
MELLGAQVKQPLELKGNIN